MATTIEKEKETPPNPAIEKIIDEKAIATFTDEFLGNGKSEDKPADKPADEVPPKPSAAPKGKPKAKAAVKPAPTARPLSTDDIAQVARTVATEFKKSDEPKPAAEVESKLSADEQKRVATLKHMETANPEKYKGVTKRYEDSLSKFYDYADKWEKDHPGETFDEDAEEHKEFREANEKGLDWEDEDYTDARADIKAKEAVENFRKENGQKFEQLEQQEKLRQSAPAIATARVNNARDFFEKLGGEFKDLLAENGVVDTKLGAKLSGEDPIQWEIATNSADLTEKLVEENYKLFNALTPFDVKNPLHTAVNGLILSKEAQLMALPAEDQLDGQGRKFYPVNEYWKLSDAQRKHGWTFTQKEVEALLINATLKQAKTQIKAEQEKFDRVLKARGITPTPKPAPVIPPVEEEIEEKPRTPALASTPRENGGAAAVENDPQEKFLKGFLN